MLNGLKKDERADATFINQILPMAFKKKYLLCPNKDREEILRDIWKSSKLAVIKGTHILLNYTHISLKVLDRIV